MGQPFCVHVLHPLANDKLLPVCPAPHAEYSPCDSSVACLMLTLHVRRQRHRGSHSCRWNWFSLKCHRAPNNEALVAVLIVSSRCPALHCQGGIPAIQLSVELVED